MRDHTAIERLAEGYLKLLYPDREVSQQEYDDNCLTHAIALRQRVRQQLNQLDPEFKQVNISIGELVG